MRGIALSILILLSACTGGGTPSLSGGQAGVGVAQAALRGGSPQIALQIAGSILAREPNNDTALIIQGEALTQLGRLDEAAASFSVVLQHDAASVGGHIGLGRVRLASDPASAEGLFLEALQREPHNAVAMNNLGIARDLQGRHADAQSAYRSAMAANPDMTAAQVNLALSLAMGGRSNDAVQLLRPLASDPGASRQVRHDMAAVLTMGGNKAEAEAILSKDLAPQEVRQAMEGYAAGRLGAAAGPVNAKPAPGNSSTPVPAPPAPPASSTTSGSNTASVQTPLPAATIAPAPAAPQAQTTASVQPADIAPISVPVQTAQPTPSAPVVQPPEPAPVQTARTEPSATPSIASAGTLQVQLTASNSEDAAQAAWRRLQQQMPDAMGGRQPNIIRVERDGRVFWRLRTAGFADAGEAAAFCERIHTAGASCIVLR
jgi:Flp pilus assembly protein TadD